MPDSIATFIEIILGPIILLIVLPVIPTIWIFLVYPFFSYRLNHARIYFPFRIKLLLFYAITTVVCLPVLPVIKRTIEHPAALFPLLKSRGFLILIAYSLITSIFHEQISKFANSPVISKIKTHLLSTLYTIAIKLHIAKIKSP